MQYDNRDVLENDVEDVKLEKEDVEAAVLYAADWTVSTIIDQLRQKRIDLDPAFQRRDAWNPEQKSKFIESIILGFPIPQIVLAENKPPRRGTFVVLDGKQRLLTLMQFAGLREGSQFNSFKIERLKTLGMLNGKNYEDLKQTEFAAAFENFTIRSVLIKNWKNEEYLHEIFQRLNTSSVALSPQELRQSLHPGKFTTYIDRTSAGDAFIPRILKIERVETGDNRMRDAEILLRYFSFRIFHEDYKGVLKTFLNETCEKMNKRDEREYEGYYQAFKKAMQVGFDIFGNNFAHRYGKNGFEGSFNKSVLDVMLYYFSDDSIAEKSLSHKDTVIQAFKDICESPSFVDAITKSTTGLSAVRTRFNSWAEKLSQAIGHDVESPFAG